VKPALLILAALFISFISGPLWAGGPILVDTDVTGDPVLWKDGVIHVNLESGPDATLGSLSSDQALALVRELFSDWEAVTIDGEVTANITIQEGAPLGSVDLSNLNDHFTYCPPSKICPTEDPPFVRGSAQTGESPILFDTDGTITDAIEGKGANSSILGFAGPRVVDRIDGVLYITEGQAVLNGRFIDGQSNADNPEVDVEEFKGAIFHEIGHMIGLDHTQVNLDSAAKYLRGDLSEADAVPTMFPLFIDGREQLSLHFDDIATLSFLYPTSSFLSDFCRLDGTTFRADGKTELQGVNVIAANPSDPLREDTSAVSGSLYAGADTDCSFQAGGFTLAGLKPGVDYSLNFEPISQVFTGGSSLEPCDPPQKDFAAESVPGTFRCAEGGGVITAGSDASTEITTTKAVAVSPTPPPVSHASSGGCSLISSRRDL
jgi:hypothetical protein